MNRNEIISLIIFIVVFLIISVIFYIQWDEHLDKLDYCVDELGGETSYGTTCIIEIDDKLVRGRVISYKEEFRWVQE